MLSKMSMLALSVIALLGAQTQSPQPDASKPPTVSLCSLLSRPADYDGKEVRVRGEYHIGFEYSYLTDSSCKEYAIGSTPFWNGGVVWTEFDSSVKENTEQEVYRKFRSEAGICCPDEWRDTKADLVVTGKFFKAGEAGYGHMARYALKIIVSKVEEVRAIERK